MEKLGAAYLLKKDYKKAREYYEQVAQLYHKTGYKEGEAGALKSLGRVYRELKDVKKAEEYEQRARDLTKPRGDNGPTGPPGGR